MNRNERIREVEHNTSCLYHDVYMWSFFEKQMESAPKQKHGMLAIAETFCLILGPLAFVVLIILMARS